MRVVELAIGNLRNLAEQEVQAAAGLNWLYGANGAGKTSVLEAVAILARGRSFRKGGPRAWIGPQGKQARIVARVRDGGRSIRLGVERSVGEWRGVVNGAPVRSLPEMSRHLPVVVFEPGAHELVEGGPEERRRYMDWGVFHVEHDFLEAWRRFARILRQRNAALRSGAGEATLNSLEPGYVEAAWRVGAYRERYVADLGADLKTIQPELMAELEPVELSYARGWQRGVDLAQALRDGRARDRELGFTHQGPHRADLKIRTGEQAVRHLLSRGQQKQTALLLLLAQYRLWQARLEQTPVLLLDDLASELDLEHRQRVMGWLARDRGQVWITGTERPQPLQLARDTETRVFHVEQGRIQPEDESSRGQESV